MIIDDPTITDDEPRLSFAFDSQGNMTSATLNGAFDDLGHYDEHTVEIDWGDGQTTTTVLPVGDRVFSVQRIFQTGTSITPEDLHPFVVYVYDDDLEFAVFLQAGGAQQCNPNLQLPAWVDQAHAHAMAAAPVPPRGHFQMTWNDLPLNPQANINVLAYTQTLFPAHPDVVNKKLKVDVEYEGPTLRGNVFTYELVARLDWEALRQLNKANDGAYQIALKELDRRLEPKNQNCWATAMRFNAAEIKKWGNSLAEWSWSL